MTQQPLFLVSTQKKIENTYVRRYMEPNVLCNIVHSGQNMGTTEVSFARWLEKEYVVHIYSGFLLSPKERWDTAICDNMNESWEYYAKQNKWVRQKNVRTIRVCSCVVYKTKSNK